VLSNQQSEYPFSVNDYKSESSKIDESGNMYESGKIFFSVNLRLAQLVGRRTTVRKVSGSSPRLDQHSGS